MDISRYTHEYHHLYEVKRLQDGAHLRIVDLPEEPEVVPENGALALSPGYDASASASSSCTRFVDPRVWERLPEELTDIVLSFLPIHRFRETVVAIDSPKWRAIFSDPERMSPKMLGHMRNVNSSFGCLLYKCRLVNQPSPLAILFEHDARAWHSLPTFPDQRPVHARVSIVTASECLMCVANPANDMLGTPTYYGVWNPYLHSLRWLPASPIPPKAPSEDRNEIDVQVHVVVNSLQRHYKVVEVYWHPTQYRWWSYAVYDSRTRGWSDRKDVSLLGISNDKILSGRTVSCGEFICFTTLSTLRDHGMLLYNTTMDSWIEATIAKTTFLEMDGRLASNHLQFITKLHSLVALEGKVYIILSISIRDVGRDIRFHIASIDPSTVHSGAPSVSSSSQIRHVTDVPAHLIDSNARGQYIWYSCLIRGMPFLYNLDGQRLLKYDIRADSWSSSDQTWPAGDIEMRTYAWNLPFAPSLTPA